MMPLRQFEGVPAEVIRKAEGKQFPWYHYFNLVHFVNLVFSRVAQSYLGPVLKLVNSSKSLTLDAGRLVHHFHSFPELQLQAQVQPITRSILQIDLSIIPDFRWDEKIHGMAETILTAVEDVDGELILFPDLFILRQQYAEDEHNITLTVPMFEPISPNYYTYTILDCWLHAETRLPTFFKYLILCEKFPPTLLLDLQPLPLFTLHNKEFEYSLTIQTFNKIQTQDLQVLHTTDENVFIGAPTSSGKNICAESALLRLWS
ncbi:uncharacterized protein LACBIDRAFT_304718 [Laccaria bicolor S238N-H82]|uniref:Predicted protein n=1 Tax=Laccaria bicolor (strain S238N-H82 / ATCC MYA-4686) TaxID=486041 RepID=B0DM58_LACBS|nr:uncharacterized protein LACBIDRAFT_304718 [Laccaria bicolor S238N-H82]EDR04135.1 predicted protein [Laccaria bicolor S238N-H82]|eukprot:XP_001885026.1 predicted protein [Laccaria bicolor S238N-H82]